MMSILTSKWTILLLLLILISLAVLYFIGNKSVHHETVISAPPEKVWAVLTDTASYPEWNTVMLKAEGDLQEGEKITYTFQQDADTQMDIPATVKQIVPNKLLNQSGGLTGVVTFDHRYELVAEGDGTRLTIHEDYRGIYVPFWDAGPVQAAYERLAEAIKERAVQIP